MNSSENCVVVFKNGKRQDPKRKIPAHACTLVYNEAERSVKKHFQNSFQTVLFVIF